jgi:hypothetical protein
MDIEPLLRYWTLQSPDGHEAVCELVRTRKGLEVRCDWSGDGAQARIARAAAIDAVTEALTLAEAWKAAYLEKGWMVRARRYPRRTD